EDAYRLRERVGEREVEASALPAQQRLQPVILLVRAVTEDAEVAVLGERPLAPAEGDGVVVLGALAVDEVIALVPHVAHLEVHGPGKPLVQGRAPAVGHGLLLVADVEGGATEDDVAAAEALEPG